jgi:hypothetical protein
MGKALTLEEIVKVLKNNQAKRGGLPSMPTRRPDVVSTSTATRTSGGSALPQKTPTQPLPATREEPAIVEQKADDLISEEEAVPELKVEPPAEEESDWGKYATLGALALAGGAGAYKLAKKLKKPNLATKGGINLNPESGGIKWLKGTQMGPKISERPAVYGKGAKAQTSKGFDTAPDMKELSNRADDVKALHKGIVDYRDSKDLADADVANLTAKINDPVIKDAQMLREVPIYKSKLKQARDQLDAKGKAFSTTASELGKTPESLSVKSAKANAEADVGRLKEGVNDPIRGVGGRNEYVIDDGFKVIRQRELEEFKTLAPKEQKSYVKQVVDRRDQRDSLNLTPEQKKKAVSTLMGRFKEAKGPTESKKPPLASAKGRAKKEASKYGGGGK